MNSASPKKSAYRVPPSLYWAQHWNSCVIGSLATFQLIMTLAIVGMEIGNSLVDLYKANIYSGFWSFPFTIAATITTYACVCAKKTQTKAIVALFCQSIAIFVLLAVIGFLIAFIVSGFTLCFGFQCSQNSTTFAPTNIVFSSTTYTLLKQVFIICELVCAVIFIIFSIIYIILFIKCLKKLPRIHPLVQPAARSAINHRLASSVTQLSRPLTMSHKSYNRLAATQQTLVTPLSHKLYYNAQKVCPDCGHISPYIPNETIVECPKCGYQSKLVEHAQQW